MPHSSLAKVAGILGIGRANVINMAGNNGDPLRFDFEKLEQALAAPGVATIVAVSCGEVNTGHFATSAGLEDFRRIRDLCDKYNAWLHVDGAFGIFARALDPSSGEFGIVNRGSQGIELADSITGDGHKLLNVPYDCGFFFCRHQELAGRVFQNPSAAYLSSGTNPTRKAAPSGLPPVISPLNLGIENSRRFRALPVYASLVSYGRDGYRDILERQIRLARRVSSWLFDHPKYTLLPASLSKDNALPKTFMIVLFGAVDDALNKRLAEEINSTSKIFVSGTVWEGRAACRIAIANWMVDEQRDFDIITEVLENVATER
jgi:glutamate/tyrosine decarboxylase-like PLP-dependent enzyme